MVVPDGRRMGLGVVKQWAGWRCATQACRPLCGRHHVRHVDDGFAAQPLPAQGMTCCVAGTACAKSDHPRSSGSAAT